MKPIDQHETPVGAVLRVTTVMSCADWLNAVRVRCNLGRMRYTVEPGLYAIGSPGADAPVFVSAKYKLSFDLLRRGLNGVDGWILVLDTKGINVWCAAGKGTFGTEELVRKIAVVRLAEVVRHREVIVPQLGAPGIAAHDVAGRTGFSVIFGPVRASDIPAFLAAGRNAVPAMRRVTFDLGDRLAVIPVELTIGFKWFPLLLVVMAWASGLNRHGYYPGAIRDTLPLLAGWLCAAYLAGGAITPLLLPWLPGRSFSVKGAWAGLGAAGGLMAYGALVESRLLMAALVCVLVATTSFVAMNFTGASTYTSQSGVKKEMRVAIPLQAAVLAAGIILWVAGMWMRSMT